MAKKSMVAQFEKEDKKTDTKLIAKLKKADAKNKGKK